MWDFKTDFYERLFRSLDNNAVMLEIRPDGSYYPIWCSEEFAVMMETTTEEYIRRERDDAVSSTHPDDREEVEYLFRHFKTRDGSNSLVIRKYTAKGNEIWVNIHYAFVKEDDIQYAYCTYTNVSDLKESQQQTQAMYEELNRELEALSNESLAALRSNLTKGVVEEVRGRDLYDVDRAGAPIGDLFDVRLANMPIASDREKYLEVFDLERLKEKYYLGEGPSSLVIFSRRQSGRQCFIKYSAAMRKDPATGDVIVLGVESEYNSQKVSEVLDTKVLARQYDMVCYIVDESYGITIGDAANVKKGNIFPKERDGNYMDYIRNQVIPVVPENERENTLEALSIGTIADALETSESYTVDVACEIDGETYNKRFDYYAVDKETKFYILLKSDVTEVLREQREREKAQTIHNSMLEQFNAIAEESLTVIRSNMTTGMIEDIKGSDLYPCDYVGNTVEAYVKSRVESLVFDEDKKKYAETFNMDKLLERSENGQGLATMTAYCKRASGRYSFVRFSGSASRNPDTDNVDAFGIETEYSSELVSDVLNKKILAKQYDMVAYIAGGYYGVVIGDAKNISKRNIFPKERNGIYMDYLKEQVIPSASLTEQDPGELLEALSIERVGQELKTDDMYAVDVACEIDGEMINKRFTYYAADRDRDFYILLKSDVTDLIKEQRERNELLANALQEAEQANVAKTAFLSSMSHEIRTPMNAIIGLDSIALKDPDLPERTREHLEKIGGSAKHLLGLINDILDMSRIESGRMALKNEEFSFREMLEQINTMIHGQCEDKNLTYECRINGHVGEYYIGDAMKLKQVIINILGNAVKFTPAPGTVSFIVERTAQFDGKSTLRFTMKDTGIGMDKSYLPKIFDAFSQEDEGKANKYGSTGLGMAITKNIVEMMNGNITVDSEKGVGSTFVVNVTLTDSDRKEYYNDDLSPQDMRVLIIDDDPVSCEHTKLVLEEVGIAADISLSGAEE